MELDENAQLAARALAMEPTEGIPSWMFHTMDIAFLEHYAGYPAGSYRDNYDQVYLDFQRKAGTCMIDQYLASNPLSMDDHGLREETAHGATTGAVGIVLDDLRIDSSEAVVEHLERFVFPAMEKAIANAETDDTQTVASAMAGERAAQEMLGPSFLKVPYGGAFGHFPGLRYGAYGYVNYLTAYCMYPEVMERDFRLQGELAHRHNRTGVRAILEGGLPRVIRLDHDMADSHGTLVNIASLDEIWFPNFAHAIQPYLEAGIRLIWHCDGDLSQMVPRLLEAGIGGFQGFQYEDNMDYPAICRMTTRDGGPLMIWGGVSVTRTLPFGSPADVRREIDWLVEYAPPVGFFLGGSSSITPGVSWDNLTMMIEGLGHYRRLGRKGR